MTFILSRFSTWYVVLAILCSVSACKLQNASKQGESILDSIPVYEGAEFLDESRTTYPDSTPSILRTYRSNIAKDQLMEYYQTALTTQGWQVESHDQSNPDAPSELLAEKDGWRISVLVYGSGQFILRVFLN